MRKSASEIHEQSPDATPVEFSEDNNNNSVSVDTNHQDSIGNE